MKTVSDVQRAIELYRAEHNGALPAAVVLLAEEFDQMVDDARIYTATQMTAFGHVGEVWVDGMLVRRLAPGVIFG